MSLINDALKRAKDVQRQTPPAAEGPALRPVDPADEKRASSAKTFLFVMVVAVVVGNVLLWLAFSGKSAAKAPAPTSAESAAPTVASVPVAASLNEQPATTPATAAPAPAPASPTVAAPTADNTAVATNAEVVFVEPPKPKVLRLQSIIYGSRPSAMIGGKFLFVGDSIQGHQVIAIDKASVTLVGEGQTNVLSLP